MDGNLFVQWIEGWEALRLRELGGRSDRVVYLTFSNSYPINFLLYKLLPFEIYFHHYKIPLEIPIRFESLSFQLLKSTSEFLLSKIYHTTSSTTFTISFPNYSEIF